MVRLLWYEKALFILVFVLFIASIIELVRDRDGYPAPYGTMATAVGGIFLASVLLRRHRESRRKTE